MLKGDQLYISEKEVGALCLRLSRFSHDPHFLSPQKTYLPHPRFVAKASSAFGLVSSPIVSAQNGHPFVRRTELELEVECVHLTERFLFANIFLTRIITPSLDIPKVLSVPCCPLPSPLDERRIFFFFATAAETLCEQQLILHPFLSPHPGPASHPPFLSPAGAYAGHIAQLPKSQKTQTARGQSHRLQVEYL